MKVFDIENFDISVASNAAICEIGDMLLAAMCDRSDEQKELDERFSGTYESLLESLSPEQEHIMDRYQEMMDESINLAERRSFIFGFKAAMRLTLECAK